MDIFAHIKAEILAIVLAKFPDADTQNITVEPPRDAAHGDMASNAAMVLAKPLGQKPRDLAQMIADELQNMPYVESCEIAGPGFLNIRLNPQIWADLLKAILHNPQDYGRNAEKPFGKVNIEFVSANPTGPMHVGHMRGAVIGDALAGVMDAAGYDVTREYYINDAGAQVDVLARSAYLRYLEAHGQEVHFVEGTYPGDYLIAVGEFLKEKYGAQFVNADEAEWLEIFKTESIALMMERIQTDLLALGVKMDNYYSERSLYADGQIEAAIDKLNSKDLIYQGVLEPPKGMVDEDWEPREQTLFRSTAYGDDVDRPIQKADGSWTYFAPDIAYHYNKLSRGYDLLIDVLGADHGGYVKRMQAAVRALSDQQVPLEVELCQLVKLFKNGEPFKMSKRAGNFVLLSDVIDEVGADAARFEILTRKSDAVMEFDFDKVKEQSKDNHVFYVQYAHARAHSILEKGGWQNNAQDLVDIRHLEHEHERALLVKLASFPRLIQAAAATREPHRLSFYLYELASMFHFYIHMGKVDPDMRIIREGDEAVSQSRMALVCSVQSVIANGLQILGVSPMNSM